MAKDSLTKREKQNDFFFGTKKTGQAHVYSVAQGKGDEPIGKMSPHIQSLNGRGGASLPGEDGGLR